jgi:hypothetical protein
MTLKSRGQRVTGNAKKLNFPLMMALRHGARHRATGIYGTFKSALGILVVEEIYDKNLIGLILFARYS